MLAKNFINLKNQEMFNYFFNFALNFNFRIKLFGSVLVVLF